MTLEATGRRDLAEFCGEVSTIKEVVAALTAIRDAAAADITRPAVDGISAFTRLYTIITQNVLDTVEGRKPKREFRDPEFLTLLDLEFAKRYLAAVKAYAEDSPTTPKAWSVLFRRRRVPKIRHVNFAAAGVNAHVNFDLTFALLETWRRFPPNRDRHHDYNEVNGIFADEMNRLRDDVDAFLSGVDVDGSPADKMGNLLSGLLVRWTRAVAWWAARLVWRHYDPVGALGGLAYRKAYDRMHRRQDRVAQAVGWAVLKAPRIP
jgi:hypothetical protein